MVGVAAPQYIALRRVRVCTRMYVYVCVCTRVCPVSALLALTFTGPVLNFVFSETKLVYCPFSHEFLQIMR